MNTKHTPGPWRVIAHMSDYGGWRPTEQMISIEVDETQIAYYGTSSEEYPRSIDENIANAHLMAAAPELLAALIEMEREKSDYMRQNNLGNPAEEHTNKMARAAIAKATGESA